MAFQAIYAHNLHPKNLLRDWRSTGHVHRQSSSNFKQGNSLIDLINGVESYFLMQPVTQDFPLDYLLVISNNGVLDNQVHTNQIVI